MADLWELSPIRFDDERSHAEAIIDALFPGDPLLCVAKATPVTAETALRSQWRGQLAEGALIVPSTMSAPTGKSKDGRVSKRCLDNTGPRRFLVVEFDSDTQDSQAARLIRLGQYAPLVTVVHSGRRSLHGWFLVEGQPAAKVKRFFRYAVALGADPATWSACQMVRLPDGLRDDGTRQTAFFYNPQILNARAN